MNLRSTTFWEKNPILIKQTSPRIKGFSKEINDYLFLLLGIPFFHFFVLETLIKGCLDKLKTSQERVVIVDVCFSEITINKMMKMFESREIVDEKDLLVDLSTWLTEQISARLLLEKSARFPAVYVHCAKMDKIPQGEETQLVTPIGVGSFLRRVLALLGRESCNDDFFILFPRSRHSHKMSISIKTLLMPDDDAELEFDALLSSFGRKNIFLSQGFESSDIYQLVGDNHVDFALARDELGDCNYAWVKHLGVHETWLVNKDKNSNSENWVLVAENSWALIEPETSIVLGRVAELNVGEMQRKIILPGSLVLALEY